MVKIYVLLPNWLKSSLINFRLALIANASTQIRFVAAIIYFKIGILKIFVGFHVKLPLPVKIKWSWLLMLYVWIGIYGVINEFQKSSIQNNKNNNEF